MHLNVVTKVPPNPLQIKDITVTVEVLENGQLAHANFVAYGPQLCKMLARFQPNPAHGDFDTGFFTERNGMLYIWRPLLAS